MVRRRARLERVDAGGKLTGSLTGHLLGAMHGLEALPKAWIAEVEMREVIERLAFDLHTSTVLEFVPDRRRYPPN